MKGLLRRYAGLTIGLLWLTGCGPRNGDLLSENKTFDDELMVRVARLAKAVDAMPLEPGSTCSAPKKLVYAPKSAAGDTDYLMYDEMQHLGERAEAERESSKLDFHFPDGVLPTFLNWIDPASKYYLGQPGKERERATPLVRESFRRAQGITHLIIVKPRELDREHGELRIDTYLADLKAIRPLCGFTLTAHADPSLGIESYKVIRRNVRTGDERVVRRDTTDNFHSALWTDARAQVFAAVKKQLAIDTPQ